MTNETLFTVLLTIILVAWATTTYYIKYRFEELYSILKLDQAIFVKDKLKHLNEIMEEQPNGREKSTVHRKENDQ
jgi:hypothetical protein